MKKKLLTAALAATMVVGSTLSAMAAPVEISGGFWTAWTPGYEVKDGSTVEFDIDVKTTASANWNGVVAVFVNKATTGTVAPKDEVGADYKEYAVIRTDSWGWGGGDNLSIDKKAIEYSTKHDTEDVFSTTNVNGDNEGVIDKWDDFVSILKDAHIDAKVSKSGEDLTLNYVVTGKNGHGFTYEAKTKADTSAGCYVFFVCDNAEVTVTQVTGSNAGSSETTTTKAPAETTTEAPTSSIKTEDGKVTLGYEGTIVAEGTKLESTAIESGDVFEAAKKVVETKFKAGQKFVAYDFSLKKDDVAVTQLDGKVKVTVDAPFTPEAGNTIVVYRVDGENLVKCDTVLKDGKVTFTTDHFSTYVFVQEEATLTGDMTSVALLVAVAVLAGAVVVSRKRTVEA